MKRIVLALALLCVLPALRAGADALARRPDELKLAPLAFTPVNAEKAKLACGIPVVLYANHDLPIVGVSIYFRMGEHYLPVEQFAACRLLNRLWATGGTANLPPDSLDARIAALAATLDAWAGRLTGGASIVLASEDLRKGLPIWRDLVVHPRLDADRMARAKAQLIKDLQAINDDPASIANTRFSWLVYGDEYPGAHVDTRAAIEAVTKADLDAITKRFVRPENALIGVAGDFDRQAILSYLDTLLAGWRGEGRFESPVQVPWTPHPQPGVYLLRGDYAQSQVWFGRIVPGLDDRSPDCAPAEIVSYALGYGRVYYRSREEGISYGAGVMLRVQEDLSTLYGFGSCRGEVTTRLLQDMREETRRLNKDPLTDEEVETSRTFQIGNSVRSNETPEAIVAKKLEAITRGLPEDYDDQLFRRLKDASRDEVVRVARKYVQIDDPCVVLVLGNPATFDAPLDSLRMGKVVELKPVTFGE